MECTGAHCASAGNARASNRLPRFRNTVVSNVDTARCFAAAACSPSTCRTVAAAYAEWDGKRAARSGSAAAR